MGCMSLDKSPMHLTQHLIDLLALVGAKGKERTQQQWLSLLAKTDFKNVSITPARAPFSFRIVEPVP